jgi:hypothetical protein
MAFFAVTTGSGKLCSNFHLNLRISFQISSITHQSFKKVLVVFLDIEWLSLPLIFTFIPFWSVRTQGIILIFLYLLRFAL